MFILTVQVQLNHHDVFVTSFYKSRLVKSVDISKGIQFGWIYLVALDSRVFQQ